MDIRDLEGAVRNRIPVRPCPPPSENRTWPNGPMAKSKIHMQHPAATGVKSSFVWTRNVSPRPIRGPGPLTQPPLVLFGPSAPGYGGLRSLRSVFSDYKPYCRPVIWRDTCREVSLGGPRNSDRETAYLEVSGVVFDDDEKSRATFSFSKKFTGDPHLGMAL